MIIDVNAYLGHFAFRRLRHNTASGLLRLMDARGIDKAWVSSASAITYRDAHSGNEELAAEVAPHRDRLIPLAVINPGYAGWRDALGICHGTFGMKGLRLYPKWHNYGTTDPRLLELIDAATALAMPISLPIRAEDYRQRSWLVDVHDLTPADIVPLLKARPAARFILVNGTGYGGWIRGAKATPLPPNHWIEISRMSALMGNEIAHLTRSLGADRMLFGTGMPFNAPDPALLKLEVAGLTPPERERVAWRNADALLGPAPVRPGRPRP